MYRSCDCDYLGCGSPIKVNIVSLSDDVFANILYYTVFKCVRNSLGLEPFYSYTAPPLLWSLTVSFHLFKALSSANFMRCILECFEPSTAVFILLQPTQRIQLLIELFKKKTALEYVFNNIFAYKFTKMVLRSMLNFLEIFFYNTLEWVLIIR